VRRFSGSLALQREHGDDLFLKDQAFLGIATLERISGLNHCLDNVLAVVWEFQNFRFHAALCSLASFLAIADSTGSLSIQEEF
jgi:hypothetical protein